MIYVESWIGKLISKMDSEQLISPVKICLLFPVNSSQHRGYLIRFLK